MSKEIVWGIFHGEGIIECECDQCGYIHDYEFDNGYPDFRDCQSQLGEFGWVAKNINEKWYDFCCIECYESFKIKSKT